MIRTLDRIQYSKTAPQNTGVLWDDGNQLKIYRKNRWDIIGSFVSKPDWNSNNDTDSAYILNRTHYVDGTHEVIDIKNCTTNTPVLPNTTYLPIIIGGTFIDSYGEHDVVIDNKELKFSFKFREPVTYIGEETIDLNVEVLTSLEIKKLDNMYLDIIHINEVNSLLEEIFDEQVN